MSMSGRKVQDCKTLKTATHKTAKHSRLSQGASAPGAAAGELSRRAERGGVGAANLQCVATVCCNSVLQCVARS